MHRIRNLAWKLPKKMSAFKTENRSPDAINVNRNYRRLDALHDPLEPAPEGKHLTDPCHLSFGKNAKQLAVLQRLSRRTQRMNQLPRALVRRNRDHAHNLRERFHQPV